MPLDGTNVRWRRWLGRRPDRGADSGQLLIAAVLTGAVIVASVLFVRSLRDIRLQGPVAVTAAEEVA